MSNVTAGNLVNYLKSIQEDTPVSIAIGEFVVTPETFHVVESLLPDHEESRVIIGAPLPAMAAGEEVPFHKVTPGDLAAVLGQVKVKSDTARANAVLRFLETGKFPNG